ncbi:acyltransferase family protein [Pedococcus sp. 5OH_020]|uniref:acyltransferase family protein n=1 Tax=Pedococcus sp. 5OH_020 TaxID=2989814 RepID=UPI0022EA05CD|nr:acyltransferase [Pedococcus sp. 5OH_020]
MNRGRPGPDAGADHGAFPALDGLRAVAVVAVVLTHAGYWTGRYGHGFGAAFLARMDSGVAVFFVISGFLLFRPWLLSAAVPQRHTPSLQRYAVRRALRILPAYWLAVVLCLVLVPQQQHVTALDWVRHALLLQIYRFGWFREGLTQTWSLATEASFYAALPLFGLAVAWWLRRAWSAPTALAACAALGAVPVGWQIWLHAGAHQVMGGFWLPAYLGWFAAGMALAVVRVHLDAHAPDQESRWWRAEALGRYPFTCWAVTAAALLAAMTPVAGPRSLTADTAGQAVTKALLYGVVGTSLVWPAVFGRSPLTMVVLANRPLRYLGDISYGMFLYHLLVLTWVMRVLGYPVFSGQVVQVFPLTVVGSAALAAVSFRFLERPFIRLGHRRGESQGESRRGGQPLCALPPVSGEAALDAPAPVGAQVPLAALEAPVPTGTANPRPNARRHSV